MSKKRCIWKLCADSWPCNHECYPMSDYCVGHICDYNGCLNGNRCMDHTCIDCLETVYSNEMRFRGSEYCHLHICGLEGCLNNYNCKIHKCKNAHCTRPRFDNTTKYCVKHICLQNGCKWQYLFFRNRFRRTK